MSGLPKVFHKTVNLPAENLRGVCGIYCFIHRASGKCYVGSSNNIQTRLKRHLYEAKNGAHCCRLYPAIREFGESEFDFEVLERCPKEKLPDREKFWMVLFQSCEKGYNTVPTPFSPRYDFSPSEQTREKLRSAGLRRKNSAETRAKISASNMGKSKHSAETRALMSRIHSGKKLSSAHKMAISDRHSGVPKTLEHRMKISAAHKGRPKPESVIQKIKLAMARMSPEARERINASRRIQVEKLSERGEILEIYRDAKEAAKAVGLAGPCGIHRCILGKLKLSAGYKWRWHSI